MKHPVIRAIIASLLMLFAPALHAVPGALERYHFPFTYFIGRYVRSSTTLGERYEIMNTTVNYEGIKRDPEWSEYMVTLAKASNASIITAEVDDRKAFWINTYNALVVNTVVENYDLCRRRGIESVPEVWSIPHPIGRTAYSLEAIENILRTIDYDPRVFLAICQGARSSPPLFTTIYNPTGLENQLETISNNFCNTPSNFSIDTADNTIHMTEYFDQHALDFNSIYTVIPPQLSSYPAHLQPVLAFIIPRLSTQQKEYIFSRKPKVLFETFNWGLNEGR